jgi:hypothetical protein
MDEKRRLENELKSTRNENIKLKNQIDTLSEAQSEVPVILGLTMIVINLRATISAKT